MAAFSASANAADTAAAAKNSVTAVFKQMNVPVEGRFNRFNADVHFDPAKIAAASAKIDVDVASFDLGSPEYNQRLSMRRAQTVTAELVRDGVPKDVISVQGYGETHLVVQTGPNVREPQNRRVEIIIR